MKKILLILLLPIVLLSQNNYSLTYAGNSSWCDLGAGVPLSNFWDGGGTVSFWIKPDGSAANFDRIYDKFTISIMLEDQVGSKFVLYLACGTTGTAGQWRTPLAINQNQWNHVIITFNTTTLADPVCYINGVLMTWPLKVAPTGTRSDDAVINTCIGNVYNHVNGFSGGIDEFAIWNSTLTSDQMLAVYNSGTPNSISGTTLLYRFEEGTGTSAASEQTLKTGTLSGVTWSTDTPGWDSGDTEQDKGFNEHSKFKRFKGLK